MFVLKYAKYLDIDILTCYIKIFQFNINWECKNNNCGFPGGENEEDSDSDTDTEDKGEFILLYEVCKCAFLCNFLFN